MAPVVIRIINALESGGIRQSEFQYSVRLVARGYKVIQVILNDRANSFPEIDGVEQIRVAANIQDYRGKPLNKLKAFAQNHIQRYLPIVSQVMQAVDTQTENVLVVNTRKVIQVPLALAIAKKFECRVLFHPGDSNHQKSEFIKKYYALLKRNRRITFVANSRSSAKSFGLDPDQFVYPGFDSTRFARAHNSDGDTRTEKRAALGLPESAPLLLFMARVEADKAPDILIEAFKQANVAEKHDARLVLVGVQNFDEPFIRELENKIRAYGLQQHIILQSYSNDVAGWFAAANIFVNSRRGVEPFGISIVEALHCGLPVLSSAYGGPEETIQEGKTGWLVKDLSVQGFTVAIKQAFAERRDWPTMSIVARESSHQFEIDMQLERYLEFVHLNR